MAIIINPSNTKLGIFCYIHKRSDGTPFYVGKGRYERAISLTPSHRRNIWHQRIVEKEGRQNIIIELILAANEQEAFELEIKYIKLLKQSYILCNLTEGGEGSVGCNKGRIAPNKGKPMSEETKAKMSLAHIGKKASEQAKEKLRIINTGKTMSEAAKHKMSISSIGKTPTEETRRKISVANMGNTSKNNTVLSEETKAKMRASWVIRKAKKAL
jgi:hypothetical protein